MPRRRRKVELCNIRDHIGWVIGQRVIDITAGDPPDVPDADPDDAHDIVLHFDNGGILTFPVGDTGFWHSGDPVAARKRRNALLKKRKQQRKGKR